MLISLLILILVLGVVVGLLFKAIDFLSIIPGDFKNAAKAIVCLIAVVILLNHLWPMAGVSLP